MVRREAEELEAKVSLYQLPGLPGYRPGNLVHVMGPWHTYGRVQCVLKERYPMPTGPTMVNGPKGFPKQGPVSLYLIRGIEKEEDKYIDPQDALPVWGFT